MSIETNRWIHKKSGKTRHYIDGWEEGAFNLKIKRNNRCEITSATLDGETISTIGASWLGGKLWADDQGKLHLDNLVYWDSFFTKEQMIQRLEEWIKAEGGLDFLTD